MSIERMWQKFDSYGMSVKFSSQVNQLNRPYDDIIVEETPSWWKTM
jgi:hypothetical protein